MSHEIGVKLDALRAALQSVKVEAWQPIDTAPKDGTRLLLWCVHENAKYASNQISRAEWEGAVIGSWTGHNGGGWTWHGLLGKITKWQYLPKPPGESA